MPTTEGPRAPALLLLLVGGMVALLALPGSLHAVGVAAKGAPAGRFTVAGNVSGLYPGVRRTLTVTVTNRNPFPIRVTSLSVTASDAGRGCTRANIAFGATYRPGGATVATKITVRARSAAVVAIATKLVGNAADACRNAKFPLRYGGKAVRA